MYFIPKAGSDLQRELLALLAEANDAQKAAQAWIKAQGFRQYYAPYHTIGGGVLAVIAPNNPDRRYWHEAAFTSGAWIPNAKNPLKKDIDLLPRVGTDRLNELIQFESFDQPNTVGSRKGSFITTYSPGFKKVGDTMVLKYPEEYDLALHPDLQEITRSYFMQMCKAADSLADVAWPE